MDNESQPPQRNTSPYHAALYHGTSEITGDSIILKSNTGIGWNAFTLGNGFYTTELLDAAKLFSHMAEKSKRLRAKGGDPLQNIDNANQAALGKVYQVKLLNLSVLDAELPLNPSEVRPILRQAGLREDTVNTCSDATLSDFQNVVNYLNYAKSLTQNPTEYLTKQLGYDALRIREQTWNNWDYWPNHIGIDFEKFKATPVTLVVYNPDKIASCRERLNYNPNAQRIRKMPQIKKGLSR